MNRKYFSMLCIALLFLATVTLAASAAPAAEDAGAPDYTNVSDNLPHPLGEKQAALRQEALELMVEGKISPSALVAEVAENQFVELAREDEDSIWTVLGEFGDLESPYGILQGGLIGPQHNQIPEPDRSVDNTTIWAPDFSRDYYMDLLFSEAPGAITMRNFYIEQSSNRYTVNGDITDWGQVPYRAAHYGRDYCGSIVCGTTTWWFVQDSVNQWYANQLAAGLTPAEIDAYLSQFDVWDRYDQDGDGNFDEPDGYIDHFQSVHAGEGQETGGGAYGADAIWSHRWYVQLTAIGAGGPILADGTVVPLGGTQVGGSQYWIGDYTIEPENGGVGVFAHEFAHDLGLPDLYDTAGNTCGSACENSTGWWTLMSSGSYGNSGIAEDGIGSKPTHMGAWEKFQLGWLDYDVAFTGEKAHFKLGPAETTTDNPQALFVVLPDKEVTTSIADPYAGDYFYYSGSGNDLDNVMYREFDLPAGASLAAQVNYDIEVDWDYAYVVVSTDGGATWTSLETNVSTTTDPNGQNFGYGITGNSGGWTSMTADLSAYTGNVMLGFRYWTDVAAVNPGFMVDEISVSGSATDGAESDAGWTYDPADGFRVTTGSETTSHFNAYVVEFRQYRGFDDSLRTGPYNFGFQDNPALGNYVEHFPLQDGVLISYWDESQSDNSTSAHPGAGLILPIDAHPATMVRADGQPWRPRIQAYDSTFGTQATDAITLHWLSQPSSHPSLPGVSVFNDNNQYYNPETPTAGVINPNTGTQIRMGRYNVFGDYIRVSVGPTR